MRIAAIFSTAALAMAAQTTDLSAQRANSRDGFWIGFGIGRGTAEHGCVPCGDVRASGSSGYLRMGGTVSRSLLLGGETTGWHRMSDGVDERFGMLAFIASWYPNPVGAFFLKFGLGVTSYELHDGGTHIHASSPAASLGAGYDIRVGRNFSITPYLNTVASSDPTFSMTGIGVPAPRDVRLNLLQVGFGFHWH